MFSVPPASAQGIIAHIAAHTALRRVSNAALCAGFLALVGGWCDGLRAEGGNLRIHPGITKGETQRFEGGNFGGEVASHGFFLLTFAWVCAAGLMGSKVAPHTLTPQQRSSSS